MSSATPAWRRARLWALVATCATIAHVDKGALGDRLTQAREAAGMTQGGLGQVVGLDRTAITKLENGERKLSAVELVAIAKALKRPLSYFVSDPIPAVVSRRNDAAHAHDTTRALDALTSPCRTTCEWWEAASS
jgi:transcriptional regulator with XRE-family HTH domain